MLIFPFRHQNYYWNARLPNFFNWWWSNECIAISCCDWIKKKFLLSRNWVQWKWNPGTNTVVENTQKTLIFLKVKIQLSEFCFLKFEFLRQISSWILWDFLVIFKHCVFQALYGSVSNQCFRDVVGIYPSFFFDWNHFGTWKAYGASCAKFNVEIWIWNTYQLQW